RVPGHGEPDERPAGDAAHGRDVREVHRHCLPADVGGRRPGAPEVHVLDHEVGGARSEEPGVTESTAASSPMPTGTPAAGAPPPPSRMRRISSSSPSSRTLTGSPAEGEKGGDDLEAPDRPSP